MSDPPVPMPWFGGGHQAQDRATSVVPAPLRASHLCPELRHSPAKAKALCAHCSQPHGRASREGAACPSPLASQWAGWALQRTPLSAPHALAVPRPSICTRAPTPRCPHAPALGELQQSPLRLVPPHPAPLLSLAAARDKLAALWGALHSVGVRCEGDGVTPPYPCARKGKPLATAPLACLKETGETPPSRCFPCHIVLGETPLTTGLWQWEQGPAQPGLTAPCSLPRWSPDRGSTLSKAVVPRQKGWALGKGILRQGTGAT